MLSRNPTRRRFTFAGAALIPLMLLLGHPAQHALLRWQVIHSDAPSQTAMYQLADSSTDLPGLVRDLWATGRMSQRHFAAELLVTRSFTYEQARPYLVEALWDADDDLRENALIYLAASRDPANLPLFAALLNDPDPRLQSRAVVIMAVQGDLSWADAMAPLLKSPRHDARAGACSTFQRWTGHDDGVIGTSPEAMVVKASVDWQNWWHAHRQPGGHAPVPASALHRLPAPPVTAHEITGKRLDLADWGHVPYVLVFWSQHDNRTKGILEQARQLGEAAAGGVRLVALNVDDMPTVHGHGYEGRDVPGDPLWDAADSLSGTFLQPEQWPWQQGLVSLDTVVSYRAQDTPVIVIVDAEGKICRRLGYDRSTEGLIALLANAVAGPPPPVDPQMARVRP